ncbi:hypothetical protein [Cellulomonas denverensis]|uniref:Uncharacterized protein n=1 Tax=Cellulomonas denverensis TaxID=264297 RepID=A0A7X6KS79_9CELL|nr:hypothetical protein [Cellulomonas denverensis]NKY21316.1 hypothetical protein [Cellulomonas denverensis]GIG24610.1 hypothetical protein Cde04nite_08540 [Cellulomonas denverensis]
MTEPATPDQQPPRPRRHRRVVRVGGEDAGPVTPRRSADDSDTGWGDRPADSNDDRLIRDVPPHWG